MPEASYILIVEDNMVSQRVTQRLVRKLGYESMVVSNGQEAVDAFSIKEFDLILMDCQMPVMDGYAATREIRSLERERGGHVPIVAVTAHTLEGNRERCIEAGMDDYITKPVKLDELQTTIESAIAEYGNKASRSASSEVTAQSPVSSGPAEDAVDPNPEPAIDPQALDQIRDLDLGGDVHPLVELADLFIEDVPLRFERLRQAINGRNIQQIEEAAHGILGSSGNMGAIGMSKQCITIKESAKTQNWEVMHGAFVALIQEFERVRAALDLEKQKLTS